MKEIEMKVNFFELTFKPFTKKVKGENGEIKEINLYSIEGNMLNSDKSFSVYISDTQFKAFGLSEFNVSSSIPRLYRCKFGRITSDVGYRDSSGNLVPYTTRNEYHFETLLPMSENSDTIRTLSSVNALQLRHLSNFETLFGEKYDSTNEEHRTSMLQLMKVQ
jgi:hypothetical protein